MADNPNALRENPGMAWRGILSMLMVGAWALFIMTYAFSWATAHTLFQSVVILIGSLIVTMMAIGVMWMAYGMRHGFPTS